MTENIQESLSEYNELLREANTHTLPSERQKSLQENEALTKSARMRDEIQAGNVVNKEGQFYEVISNEQLKEFYDKLQAPEVIVRKVAKTEVWIANGGEIINTTQDGMINTAEAGDMVLVNFIEKNGKLVIESSYIYGDKTVSLEDRQAKFNKTYELVDGETGEHGEKVYKKTEATRDSDAKLVGGYYALETNSGTMFVGPEDYMMSNGYSVDNTSVAKGFYEILPKE